MIKDGFGSGSGGSGDAGGDEDDGWLQAGGGMSASHEARIKDVRTVDESGNVGDKEEEEEEIPDMEDDEDDDEAIIREPAGKGGSA